MSEPARPSVALLTPRGRGGIAVLALAGAGSSDVLSRVFRSRGEKPPAPGEIVLGRLEDRSGLVDEVLAARPVAPEETAEERIEIGCHGGPGVARRALAALVGAGALEKSPGELERSFSRRDTIEHEALERAPLALTELAAKVLLSQAAGKLSSRIDSLLERIAREGKTGELEDELLALEKTAKLGIACWRPPRVALSGRPNAGKSTLFNALLGRERAIVSSEPGTTRDAIEEASSQDGLPVSLVDLAGARDSEDPIERQGVRRGAEEAQMASLELLVVDISVAQDEGTRAFVAERASGAPGRTIAVLTKRDLLSPELRAHARTRIAAALPESVRVLEVSAKTGEGLSALRRALVSHLAGTSEPEALALEAVVTTERQRALLERARLVLSRGERDAAVSHMKTIKAGEPEPLST
ncbi:GTP-binding protein [bacterium]|nr:GTP-binding protein [bacterium]